MTSMSAGHRPACCRQNAIACSGSSHVEKGTGDLPCLRRLKRSSSAAATVVPSTISAAAGSWKTALTPRTFTPADLSEKRFSPNADVPARRRSAHLQVRAGLELNDGSRNRRFVTLVRPSFARGQNKAYGLLTTGSVSVPGCAASVVTVTAAGGGDPREAASLPAMTSPTRGPAGERGTVARRRTRA